jgi:hypothetical protein
VKQRVELLKLLFIANPHYECGITQAVVRQRSTNLFKLYPQLQMHTYTNKHRRGHDGCCYHEYYKLYSCKKTSYS